MILLRRLGLVALVLALGQVIFGAIVRITGSGMGCGDDWPRCLGRWFPPLDRPDLIIEWSHRVVALALSIAVVALVALAFSRRREDGVAGPRGVLRPAALGAALVVAAALLGAVTVKLELSPLVVVAHLIIAMTLLAALLVVVVRAGGFGGASIEPGSGSARSARATTAAVGLAFVVILLGGLTANIPGAAPACQGFPLCNGSLVPSGGPAHVHMTHRIVAVLLFFHLVGIAIATQRRVEPAAVVRWARIALALAVLQIGVAVALVETFLPRSLQSIHQAVGTLVWIAIVTVALLARKAARGTGVWVVHPDEARAAGFGMPDVERRSQPRTAR